MKIVQVRDYIAPAKDAMGAERVVERLSKGLIKRGHKVQMLLAPGSQCPVEGAELVKSMPDDADFVHYHGWEPKEYKKQGKPWAATIHGYQLHQDREFAWPNPHVIAVSRFAATGIGAIHHVWNCADEDEFTLEENKDDYFLWMAGTDWRERKGLFSTINFAKVLKVKLKIAGTGKDKETIQDIVNACNDKVEYLGAVNGEAKVKLLQKAKALILFTLLPDACPVTVCEAMMCGTPVIGSMNGAMPEIVLNNITGFTCQSFAHVVRAFNTIEKIRPRTCREFAVKHFSIDACARSYEQIYHKVIRSYNQHQESNHAR